MLTVPEPLSLMVNLVNSYLCQKSAYKLVSSKATILTKKSLRRTRHWNHSSMAFKKVALSHP